jgi:hypothetical protein
MVIAKIKIPVSDGNWDPIIQHVTRNSTCSHTSHRLFWFIFHKDKCKCPHFINKPDTWGLQQSLNIWRTALISGLFCYLYLGCSYEAVHKLRPVTKKKRVGIVHEIIPHPCVNKSYIREEHKRIKQLWCLTSCSAVWLFSIYSLKELSCGTRETQNC